ncbi:hypothetical protein CN894_11720 [Bacillus thuringiensis]|uniref:hypothetical protein n=1 Tax=Bacillus thuringiensis TaxID=1428 RepID=UPI000BFB68AE|nr:hypothetical protein [Bacillus thuringiensis]PGH72147.1 hypothetical protein CN894_11720 [Bacillus thuringiensis]
MLYFQGTSFTKVGILSGHKRLPLALSMWYPLVIWLCRNSIFRNWGADNIILLQIVFILLGAIGLATGQLAWGIAGCIAILLSNLFAVALRELPGKAGNGGTVLVAIVDLFCEQIVVIGAAKGTMPQMGASIWLWASFAIIGSGTVLMVANRISLLVPEITYEPLPRSIVGVFYELMPLQRNLAIIGVITSQKLLTIILGAVIPNFFWIAWIIALYQKEKIYSSKV